MKSIDEQARLPADHLGDVAAALLNLVAEVVALSARVAALETSVGAADDGESPGPLRVDEIDEVVRRIVGPLST